MELNNNLSTITNYEEWHHLLIDSSKEKLVDIIIGEMYRNQYFVKEVKSRLIETHESRDELMDAASETDILFEKVKLYITVIKCMEDAMNSGAGYECENEFVIEDIIDSSSKEVVKNVRDLQSTITMDEHKHLFEYMANVTIDGASVWSIEKILKKLRNYEKER